MRLTCRINYRTVGVLDEGLFDATDTDLIVIGCQTISSVIQTLKINNAYYLDNDISFHALGIRVLNPLIEFVGQSQFTFH